MTIRELAKQLNCSYEAVRKQTKRYAKELKDHIYIQHKTQYLDDYACEFIKSKRMDSPVAVSRIEYDEAVELLKQKYTDLLEKHTALKEERDLLVEKNSIIPFLEEDRKAAEARAIEAEAKAAAEVSEMHAELADAHDRFEAELQKKDADHAREIEERDLTIHEMQRAWQEYWALPFIKRIFAKKPEIPGEMLGEGE